MKNIKPFGPTIGITKISKKLINKLNNEFDLKSTSKKSDYSTKLASQIKNELLFSRDFVKKNIDKELKKIIKKFLIKEKVKNVKDIKILNFWVVRQFKGEYNPIHYHNGDISGVGYLKIPKFIFSNKKVKNKKDLTNGTIDFINGQTDNLQTTIMEKIRIPRVALSGVVGASLAISGASLQGLFRNPLADPGLIGVSAGAALGATLSIVLGKDLLPSHLYGAYLLPLSAIIGSTFVIMFLFAITQGFGRDGVIYLILGGIAVNAFTGVGIGILTYISDDAELRSLTFWTMGSFGATNWKLIIPGIFIILPTMLFMIKEARKLDLLQLGEIEASRLGVNIKKLRMRIVFASATMVGVSVALSGMIGFVGLIVPHLSRLIGGVKHNYVLPSSALVGASIMIIADVLSRVIIRPAELPVGLITSGIGSPLFLWLIYRMRV